jgi:hypothetical protein
MVRRNNTRAPTKGLVSKTSLSGGMVRVGADPPTIIQRPWNNLTIRYEGTTPIVAINPVDVKLLLEQQLAGVSAATVLEYDFKFRSARLWGAVEGDTRLWGDFYDLAGTGDDPLCQPTDFPGRNQRARIGYRWPLSSQNIVMSSTEMKDILRGNFEVMYLTITWRLKFEAPPALLGAEHPSQPT